MQKFDSERRERRRSTNARSPLSLSSWRSHGPQKTPRPWAGVKPLRAAREGGISMVLMTPLCRRGMKTAHPTAGPVVRECVS
jgi:hypothetical protein